MSRENGEDWVGEPAGSLSVVSTIRAAAVTNQPASTATARA
jgi:hypothetical protein